MIDLSSRLPEIFDIDTCLPDLSIDDTRRSLLANWRWMMNLTRLAFRLDEHGSLYVLILIASDRVVLLLDGIWG